VILSDVITRDAQDALGVEAIGEPAAGGARDDGEQREARRA